MHTPGADGRGIFPSEAELRFSASGRETGKGASRFAPCSKATAVGKFYELHPGSASDAAKGLVNNLTRATPLRVIPGFTPTEGLRIAPPRPLQHAQGRARGRRTGRARTARVSSVKGVGADDLPLATERFVRHGKLGATAYPEEGNAACWVHEGLLSDGLRAELSEYSDVFMPASVFTVKKIRRTAALYRLRGASGKPCTLGSVSSEYFDEEVLAASGCLDMVAALHEAKGTPPRSCGLVSAAWQQRGERTTGPRGSRRLRARSIGCSSLMAAPRSPPRGSAAT